MTVTVDPLLAQPQGMFHSWLSLPREEAFAKKALQYILISNVIWFIMFFVVGHLHPLPASLTKNCKPYDKLVLRHRLVCVYHGIVAWLMAIYWHITVNDRSCSKRISDLELAMLVNTSAHFVWDCAFMKYHGFLDMGNLIHHIMGIVTYYFTAFQQHNHNLLCLNILPAEFSNVNMHLREVYKRLGMRYTWAYYFNEYQYCFTYIVCRSIWIPAAYYWMYTCDTTNPAVLIIYPLHCVMSWYYVSLLPPMIKSRNKELAKLKAAKLQLDWFTPLPAEKVKEAGVSGGYEAYKM
jgi:TLC domain